MVFFNYSTMQMAAKVVYYGPGLCGKTTNLQYIYGHTANDSRGEMVSLETETDRTLFFDLLPIDVGSIAGFNTRIQLYTVPGQVFYNTTRKLVLKGVDGVVFVADSQRPMLSANLESLRNLEENVTEMGLSFDSLPIVIQYNKRDLPDTLALAELEKAINPRGWPSFEASAVAGEGVFETLRGITKLTLINLKKRLTKSPETPSPRPAVAPAAAAQRPVAPAPRPGAPVAGAARPKATQVDVLAELEKIRRQAMKPTGAGASSAASPVRPAPPPAPPAVRPTPVPASAPVAAVHPAAGTSGPHRSADNGKGEIHRSIELTLKRHEFLRARRFLLNLKVEDADRQQIDAIRDLPIDLANPASLERFLLQLSVAVKSKD